jgi:hypothetical protein
MSEKQYNGWLASPSLIKRSLAVVGHYLFGQIVVCLVVVLPLLLLALLFRALFQ